MPFHSSQAPLLKCFVAHRIPGRVRLVCRAVRYLSAEQVDLENHFSQLRGVRAQRMSCAASSVVISYDPATYGLARHTMDVIRQNFFVSVGVNTVGLLLGGLGLIPVIVGATLHNASTILVVGNSLRIFLYDMRDARKA